MPLMKVLGGGREVGRVALLFEDKGKFLLDYGVNFDEKDRPQLPLHVRPSELDFIAVSHAHLDHIGAAPLMYITGKPRIILTKPTLEISNLLIQDFLKLNSTLVDYEYSEFVKMSEQAIFTDYGKEVDIDGYKIVFMNAGHILGSSSIFIETPSGHKLLYTGDINNIQTWTLSGAELWPVRIDTLIIESTYGSRNHPPRYKVEKRFISVVEEVLSSGGTVLIPAFSVGRSQEVLTILANELPYADIYVDGMAREVCGIYLRYQKYLRDPSVYKRAVERAIFVRGVRERKKALKEPSIIIATAGMLKGGPSLWYLKKLYDNPKNAVLLVSYQAPNSPGHLLLEKGGIDDTEIPFVKARVEWFDFSSHAGRDGLIEIAKMYSQSLRNIVIIHGDSESATSLGKAIRDLLGNDINIIIPSNSDVVNID
ncbi:MBL fold metallo-hydrolase [Thermogladius sp. 4427co]|uniref:MBL fold metallo-hydrolase n=1 Tax=Thermogladius sp. 4427co TaxID=3450718 RepID=UPI003F7A4E06